MLVGEEQKALKPKRRPGEAPIKEEYLKPIPVNEEASIISSKRPLDEETPADGTQTPNTGEANPKRERKRGQNKKRILKVAHDSIRFCQKLAQEESCPFGDDCKFSHDIPAFLAIKGQDIGDKCIMFDKTGFCRFGLKCRYASSHLDPVTFRNIKNQDIWNEYSKKPQVLNCVDRDFQKDIRKCKSEAALSIQYLNVIQEKAKLVAELECAKRNPREKNDDIKSEQVDESADPIEQASDVLEGVKKETVVAENAVDRSEHLRKIEKLETEISNIKIPYREKKKTIDFKGKTYLAPLTTVGNLPFRRICKQFGVDITCSEMAMASSLINGQQSEWALAKRHVSEDIFGLQICGADASIVTRVCEFINDKLEVDFVDLNCGCPIDLVCKTGAGSSLMGRINRLENVVRGMNAVLECPVTVKIRTGIKDGKNTAHKLIEKMIDWKVSAITLHGRSKEQRYTRLADWDYISSCATIAKKAPKDYPIAFFGNGDVYSYDQYQQQLDRANVDGVMIGRGALQKPWIFTEIKERRIWDISSRERLDMLRDFADFGLEHWGSDTVGVNNTRKFLCEWLSHLYRYIPVGLLEVLPQKMNERPPPYVGRDDLETLMASPNSSDWVRITEMLLGPAPNDFIFTPKHKSNSWE